MTVKASQSSTPIVHKPKRIKRFLWLALIPVLLLAGFFGLYVYVYVLGGTISPARLVHTDTCGKGTYRLLAYEYDNGDGYLELVDQNTKVLDKSTFSNGAEPGPFDWAADCRSVTVGTDKDRIDLKAPR